MSYFFQNHSEHIGDVESNSKESDIKQSYLLWELT